MSRLVFNRRACLAPGASALAALAVPRTAGAWVPTRPVAPWVPWAAGGTTDIPLRILAELAKCDQYLD